MEQQYLADSNCIIDYVGNKLPEKAALVLDGYFNVGFTISIISKIEVIGFNLQQGELKKVVDFIALANLVYIDEVITEKTIELRKAYKIKLLDAIIAATELVYNLPIITRNAADFKNIAELMPIDPYRL